MMYPRVATALHRAVLLGEISDWLEGMHALPLIVIGRAPLSDHLYAMNGMDREKIIAALRQAADDMETAPQIIVPDAGEGGGG